LYFLAAFARSPFCLSILPIVLMLTVVPILPRA
jgi:hypothetical protein